MVQAAGIPPGFQLADPDFHIPQKIDMLIGNRLFFKIVKSGLFKLSDQLPELRETCLGWVVTGELEEPSLQLHEFTFSHTVTGEDVYNAVQKFWKI